MTQTADIRPDMADELVVGRPYPLRDATAPVDSTTARRLLSDIRQWWLDAAEGYLQTAEAANTARDHAGAAEAISDAHRALAAARHFAPRGDQ